MKINRRNRLGQFIRGDYNLGFGYGWLILLAIILAASLYASTPQTLISPVAEVVPQAYAKEPEVKISCDNPKGYLECQVYKGIITWDQHDKIAKIINCESRWNPDAINTKNSNGTYDAGLAQINSIHKNISNADKFDYKKSIDWMIAKVKKDGGYQAWSCARKLGIKN